MERVRRLVRAVGDDARVIYWTNWWTERRVATTIARVLICAYFANEGATSLEVLLYGVEGTPFFALPLLAAALALAFNRLTVGAGAVLLASSLWDAGRITLHQLAAWADGGPFYVNELMVKMFSVAGAMSLLLSKDPYFQALRSNPTIAGLLLSSARESKHSTRRSLLLLSARGAISTLFIYVGITELSRQLAAPEVHGNHVHQRPAGDGHNNVWPKLVEFLLSLPLAIGLQTVWVSRGLATTMIAEAFVYWRFWASELGLGYALHARQHFFVNLAVAGGLVLLQDMGAGKYSVDELLKKKE